MEQGDISRPSKFVPTYRRGSLKKGEYLEKKRP